jgi:hypothetical protein
MGRGFIPIGAEECVSCSLLWWCQGGPSTRVGGQTERAQRWGRCEPPVATIALWATQSGLLSARCLSPRGNPRIRGTSPEKRYVRASTSMCLCSVLAWGRTAMRRQAPLMLVRCVGSHRPPPLLVSCLWRQGSLRVSWTHAMKHSLLQ